MYCFKLGLYNFMSWIKTIMDRYAYFDASGQLSGWFRGRVPECNCAVHPRGCGNTSFVVPVQSTWVEGPESWPTVPGSPWNWARDVRRPYLPRRSCESMESTSKEHSTVASLICSFNITAHCYADDTQLYVPFTPGIDEEEVCNKLEDCINALHVWMNKNRLKLNDKKLSSSYLAPLLGWKTLQQPPFVWVKRQFQHVIRCITSLPCLTLKWKWIHKWTPCVRVRGSIYTRLGK